MSRWFRLYDEVLDDPKVQKLSPEHFKIWINLLCLASKHDGVLPDNESVSFALRMPFHETSGAVTFLFQAGLFDRTKKGLVPHGWSKRQYKSDTSTERVKRFRQRYRNGEKTVTVTPPDTDTDTEQKQIQRQKQSIARGSRLPPDWTPEGDYDREELERFRDYWIAKAGKDGVKLDWQATWRNWLRNSKQWKPTHPIAKPSGGDPPFPETGSIRYTVYADRVRALGLGLDPDWLADRFRAWASGKGIDLAGPDAGKAFMGFSRAQKRE